MLSEHDWLQNCVYSSSWRATVRRVTRSWTKLSAHVHSHTHIHIYIYFDFRNTEFWQVKNDWLWCVMCVCVCVCARVCVCVQGGGIWGRPFLVALLSFSMFRMCILGTMYTMRTVTTYSFDNFGGNERLEMLVCISCVHMVYSLLYNNILYKNIGNHVTIPSAITERRTQTRL